MLLFREIRLTRGRGLALTAACGCSLLAGCRGRGEAERVPPPPVVAVAEARRMTVPMKAEPIATTRALESVTIRARVSGFLKEQHFEEGAAVKKGQLLFVIEEDQYRAKLDLAKATLAQYEATLEKARKSKAREVAAATLAADQATAQLAQIEEHRQRNLRTRNANTQDDLDQAVANRKKLEAQVEADRAKLEQEKSDYEVNIQGALAEVASAKANVRDAELNLGYCRMDSPIDGRVGEAKVKLGNYVGPGVGGQGPTELATVQQLDPMGVDLQVSSRYLDWATRLTRQGLPIKVTRPVVERGETAPQPGKVFFIDNTIDPTTSTFLSKARVDNPKATLLPGEYVKAEIVVGEVRDAVVVPEQSVVETQAGPTVYTVDAKGKVAMVPVKATITYEGLRVIESGLEPGQAVIVEGLQLVRPGMTVKAERAAPDTRRSGAVAREAAPAGGDRAS
jgi:membrane fusion protein, multidrug efflux system